MSRDKTAPRRHIVAASQAGSGEAQLGKEISIEINASVLPNNGQRLARTGQNRG